MKMSKVGNQTNSQDPQAVNSRTFVGNLNTFQCSKTDVERMFQRYGRIAGISMHKGYAFVQFTNPFDARSACLGEDGRIVVGQILDVNMVAEPKPHQTGRKRQNVSKTGNDWDYYYDSYYASAVYPPGLQRLVPPLKRPRLMVQQTRQVAKAPAPQKTQQHLDGSLNQLRTYSNPDILICGNCREMFTDVHELLDHKKTYCKLRFTCKCHTVNGMRTKSSCEELASNATLMCGSCKDAFHSAWDLMVHVQAAHMINIYELGVAKDDNNSADSNHDKESGKKNGRETTPVMEDDDGSVAELSSDDILASPEQDKMDESIHDKDLEELMAVESTAQACIMHALHIEQAGVDACKNGTTSSNQAPVMVAIANGD